MRHWLLTSTTYGTWLPGDHRRSVTDVTGQTEITEPQPRLARYAATVQKASPVLLTPPQAKLVVQQFQETCAHRKWGLLALSVMENHFHVVLAFSDDPDPKRVLVDLKAYGSRALNREFSRRPEGWWTQGGSRRKLPDERAVAAAVNYVLHKQPNPLAVWSPREQDHPGADASG